MPADEALTRLASDRTAGLSVAEAAARLARHGANELTSAPPVPLWKKFLGQFRELVIWILIAAAIISGAMGEWIDTGAILAIVLMNAILGFIQEEKAGRALAALQDMSSPMARAVRGGKTVSIPARELVPGDRIEVEAGDRLPADARLAECFSLAVQEAALTGESNPVDKRADAALDANAPLGDRVTMLYMGTVCSAGKGAAIVVATGMETELGRIAGMLEREEPEPTPLQRRLAELGKTLVFVCLGIVSIIFALELFGAVRHGEPLMKAAGEVFLIAVSLAVAAVPEGLPAVVTVALALGLQRMVKRNALVRKLPSVETLGSVTVICSDKTGTLTRNEMTAQKIHAGGRAYAVTGAGYAPQGDFLDGERKVAAREEADLWLALRAAAACNNAKVAEEAGQWKMIGDPTEGALIVAAMKAGWAPEQKGETLHEIPFSSERKSMSVVVKEPGGGALHFSKGAPEVILGQCDRVQIGGKEGALDEAGRKTILDVAAAMAGEALRVLAAAYRPHEGEGRDAKEERLIFLGLFGMKDPPREEAKAAVEKCRAAGIRPVMITGDHPLTALAVARELGIAAEKDRAVAGAELDGWDEAALEREVEGIPVYARVTAEHKLRIVKAWKKRGQIVAMTGDGVNDAPAVKASDIGVAMGITGTDVTKEAADMVLTDDNFASIVNAVEEGRGIFANIQKFVHYLLACNTGEVLCMFVAALVGWPAPLAAVHLLWINLVTDGLPALALGVEPTEPDVMTRPPRPPGKAVVTRGHALWLLLHGSLLAGAALTGFGVVYQVWGDGEEASLGRARTAAFCIMAFSQLAFALACRSPRRTMPELGPFSNKALIGAIALSAALQFGAVSFPFTRRVFEVSSHSGMEWALVIGLSLVPVTVIEAMKIIRAAMARPASHS